MIFISHHDAPPIGRDPVEAALDGLSFPVVITESVVLWVNVPMVLYGEEPEG